MMVNVYVIRSYKDGRFYVGMTKDLERRIQEHESGKTKSTKGFRPWKLIFTESFPNFSEARKSVCNSLLNNNGLIAYIEIKFNLMTIDFDSRLDDIDRLGVRLHGDSFSGYVLTTKEFNLCNGFDHARRRDGNH